MGGDTAAGEPVQAAALTINLGGAKVALGPVRQDLVPLYTRWLNDFEVLRTRKFTWRPLAAEAGEAWYAQVAPEQNVGQVTFTIYERTTLRPLGLTMLFDIDYFSRTAEYAIAIGEKDCWGKGYGTETTVLMLDYAFTGLCLHHVRLRTVSFNERGIRAYTRAGFRQAGRLREAHRFGGRAFDVVLMDCLATEFQSPVHSRFVPEGGARLP
jgi:RimJ/RimL family protein N-acetyltransferase